MRLYGGGGPYAVGHFLARVPMGFRTYSQVLFETRSEPSPLIRVEQQNMSCRRRTALESKRHVLLFLQDRCHGL